MTSREPAHWTKATFFGASPSEGRWIFPPVGPLFEARRSIWTFEITFGSVPPPSSGSLSSGYACQPVATTTEPTSRVSSRSFASRSMASYSHASTQAWQPSGQASRSRV